MNFVTPVHPLGNADAVAEEFARALPLGAKRSPSGVLAYKLTPWMAERRGLVGKRLNDYPSAALRKLAVMAAVVSRCHPICAAYMRAGLLCAWMSAILDSMFALLEDPNRMLSTPGEART